jgi:regulator of nonsense transcripts 3
MSASARGRNGVLPVNPGVMKKPAGAPVQPKPAQKAASPKLRLIVRRLPPGLTEAEFWPLIGEEWRVGAGKVDWAAFKEGKVSNEYASK